MSPPRPPDDISPDADAWLLHAYVDGQLPPERLAELTALLQRDPQAAERAAAWQAQRLELRRLAHELPLDEAPAALTAPVRRAASRGRANAWRQAAAAAVLLAAGGGTGWWLHGTATVTAPKVADAAAAPAYVRDAAIAHAVYTPEKRHPVEVTAAEEAHLVQWLSRRLGAPLKVPSLADHGFRLLGGRLLPGEGAPRAQFMYEDEAGRRLTLFVAVFAPGRAPGPTEFRLARDGAAETFYWAEDRFGYALSAELPPAQLQAIARAVYAQMPR